MTSLLLRNPFVTLVAIALSGSIALAQTPAPQTSPAPESSTSAPIERHAPPPPAGQGDGGRMHGAMHRDEGGPHAMMGSDHGPGEMGGGFHIAPGGMWWKNPRVVQNLALTPDQVKRMDGIFQESRLKLIDLHANVQKQEVVLEPLLSANPLDTAKTQAQIDKVADARAELEKADARMLLGIRGVLTPDQWTKLHDRRGSEDPGGPGAQGGPGGGPGRGPHGGAMDNLVDP